MNIAELIRITKETALRSPLINQSIDGDVYQINNIENQYSIFCITPMSVTPTDQTLTVNCILFYVDRLTEDEGNANQIYSDGVSVLNTIVDEIQNEYPVEISDTEEFTLFKYKFTDNCGGVFLTLNFIISNDDCEESYLVPKSGGESVIEIIKQNGITLPIVDKTVNIDAYTRANVDSLLLGINTSIGELGSQISGVDTRVTNLEQNQPTVERFTVRYNPKFDTLHRPAGDRSPLLLNRSSIETIDGKRFFNIDLIYNNYIPGSAPSQGFEQGEILFLFPRMAAVNYSDYTSLLDSQYTPIHTPTELYTTGQYYVAGWINRINEINTSTGANAAMCCQISNVGEVVNNTTGFFKSTTTTQDNVYHITGRYEIASDWTIEEYNNYNFL